MRIDTYAEHVCRRRRDGVISRSAERCPVSATAHACLLKKAGAKTFGWHYYEHKILKAQSAESSGFCLLRLISREKNFEKQYFYKVYFSFSHNYFHQLHDTCNRGQLDDYTV